MLAGGEGEVYDPFATGNFLRGGKAMRKDLRELLKLVEPMGWTFDGHSGSKHVRLRHTSGAQHVVAGSPSDQRALKNTVAGLRRAVREMEEVRG
jgi:predicted RNA binding protein YcfA (HicA-like mRNA interferase family)